MKLFKNKVGRPSNEMLKKRRVFYSIIIVIVIVVIASISYMVSRLNNKNFKGASALATKFIVEENTPNCFTVYKPLNAKYWRVHVYYSNTVTIPIYKVLSNQKYDHYNDSVSLQKFCFTKQKSNKEAFRVYVKWATNNKDTTYDKNNGSWKPDGWSYNKSIGYAYKNYVVDWSKTVNNMNDVKTTTKVSTTTKNQSTKNVTTTTTKKITTTTSAKKNEELFNDPLDAVVTKYAGTPDKDNVVFVSAGTQPISFKIQNKTGQTKYYRWILWNSMYENINYNVYNGGCIPINNGSILDKNWSATVSATYPIRKGALRLYDSESQCTGDNNLKGSYAKQLKFTYVINNEVSKVSVNKYVYDSKGNTIKANSSGNFIVTKEDTYYINYVLHNYSEKKYYANWFTYSSYDYNKKPSYGKPDYCFEYSTGVIKNPSLKVTIPSNNRSGKYKIYSSMDSCKADKDGTSTKGVIGTYPVKVGMNKTATNSSGFTQLIYNIKELDSNIGPQAKRQCGTYAMYYGNYILNGSKTSQKNYEFVNDISLNNIKAIYNFIRSEIDAGRPVRIKTNGDGQHYILITGYKPYGTATLTNYTILNYLWSIDPYDARYRLGPINSSSLSSNGRIEENVANKNGFGPSYLKDGIYAYWKKK